MKSQGFKIGGVGSPKNEFLRLGISDSGGFEGAESILVVRFPINSIVRVEKSILKTVKTHIFELAGVGGPLAG